MIANKILTDFKQTSRKVWNWSNLQIATLSIKFNTLLSQYLFWRKHSDKLTLIISITSFILSFILWTKWKQKELYTLERYKTLWLSLNTNTTHIEKIIAAIHHFLWIAVSIMNLIFTHRSVVVLQFNLQLRIILFSTVVFYGICSTFLF